MTVVVFLCPNIPSSSCVDFCLNKLLRGVDRSVNPHRNDGDGDIVSAEESREVEVEVLWCVRRLSVLSEPRTRAICKDRWCNAQVVNR